MSDDPGLAAAYRPRLDLLPFLTAEFARTAAEHDRSGIFPVANIRRLHEAGLLGLSVPVEHGGPGAGLETVVSVLGAVARGEPSTALVLAMNLMFHGRPQDRSGWPAGAYERVATSCLTDGALVNALRVEPDLGTPARGGIPATTARWNGARWELTGRKIYSTGAPVLSWMQVWAATDPASDPDPTPSGRPRVGAFLVPANSPGVTVLRTWDHLGMRATESHDVVFDQVALDADAALTLTDANQPRPMSPAAAAWAALVIAAVYLGVAEAGRDWLIQYLHERVPTNLGRPLASLPRFQSAVGEIEVRLTNARVLLEVSARGVDAGDEAAARRADGVKAAVTDAAINAVGEAVALIGNPGLTRANPLERHYRDVLCSRIHTPQDDIVYGRAGRAALGM
jgi:alkylation response protein AidB-like acyl-CoA dehydrogenase